MDCPMAKYLFLTLGDASVASSRVRSFYLSENLSKLGHVSKTVPIREIKGILTCLRTKWDVITVQKCLPNRFVIWLLKNRCKRLLFEIDDAIYLGYPGQSITLTKKYYSRTKQVTSKVHGVTTPSFLIAADLKGMRFEKPVLVFPGPVVGKELMPKDSQQRKNICIWLGSDSTQADLEIIDGTFYQELEDWDFIAIGAKIAPLPWVCVEWSVDTQDDYLAKSRVGVVPVSRSPFNDRKSAFKLMEYLRCGLIVVASPVPSTIGRDSDSAIEFASSGKWGNAVKNALANQENLLREGKYFVHRNSVAKYTDKWISFVESL